MVLNISRYLSHILCQILRYSIHNIVYNINLRLADTTLPILYHE